MRLKCVTSILATTPFPKSSFNSAKIQERNATSNKTPMLGSTLTSNSLLQMIEMVTNLNLKSQINWSKLPAWKKSLNRKCSITEGSVSTLISAFQESVTKRPTSARAESKESPALIILNVTRLLLAGPPPSGHMRLSVCQWLMLGRYAKPNLIASQGISAGNFKLMLVANVLRSTQHLTVSSSYGTLKNILK